MTESSAIKRMPMVATIRYEVKPSPDGSKAWDVFRVREDGLEVLQVADTTEAAAIAHAAEQNALIASGKWRPPLSETYPHTGDADELRRVLWQNVRSSSILEGVRGLPKQPPPPAEDEERQAARMRRDLFDIPVAMDQ